MLTALILALGLILLVRELRQNDARTSVLPRVFPYAGGGGAAMMESSTSPVPRTPRAAAYVGRRGRFHGTNAMPFDRPLDD